MNNTKTSSIIYQGQLRTEATHIYSGSIIETDAPLDNHGLAQRFSPTDLMATSLGSCMLSIMGIKTQTMTVSIDGARCDVTKHMASDPRRISQIDVDIYFPKGEFSDKDKKILENAAMACPVAKSMHPDIIKNVSFFWSEE